MKNPSVAPSPCSISEAMCTGVRLRGGGALEKFRALQEQVEVHGACSLPGCTIKYDNFVPVLKRAQSRGYVKDHEADYVLKGLWHGFDMGLNVEGMSKMGKRAFKNYPSAMDTHARKSVTAAVRRRVDAHKTVSLGPAGSALKELWENVDSLAVFPMGAVVKPNQPEGTPPELVEWRPTSDHTRTGFNHWTVLGLLRHSLNTYKEVEWLLKQGYFMTVGDVQDAFLLLPLHPKIWLFMLFRWSLEGDELVELFLHLFADFGTKGAPGTFELFMVRTVVQMARSEMVLVLPIVIYVDDAGLIGDKSASAADEEMDAFQTWSEDVCGVLWKRKKNRSADIPQYYIGFWWDSIKLVRSLDSAKLARYLDVIADAARAPKLTLRDRQSLGGKIQRAIMTMPPGAACLLVNCYAMTCNLTLPWHSRRTSRAERQDYAFVHDMLKFNVGSGYYSYDGFEEGPTVLSDASKSRAYTGGGYVESTGFYDFWKYGTSAARKPIDFLEGDTVLQCCRDRAHTWKGMIVHFGIDNQVFQRSAAKGRSKVHRLNTLLKELFVLQIQHGFVLSTFWISTHDNYLADDLSRDREHEFLLRWATLPGERFFLIPGVRLRRAPDAGRHKQLPADEDPGMAALRQLLQTFSSNSCLDGPNRGAGVGGDAQLLSISYDFTTVYEGLPPDLLPVLDEVMDNRIAVSSRAKMMSGWNRWCRFCDDMGWSAFLRTGFKRRGGRLAAWVLNMVTDTALVFGSISTYVWGVRTWHVMQHQADPCFGVMHWREFMAGVAVLTAVPSEPRKQFPLEDFRSIMAALDPTKRENAQFGLVMLVLLFTFSRTECPCPKTWSGADSFDPKTHWQVRDFRLLRSGEHWVLWVRFKAIKQDKRLERPSAGGPTDLPFEDTDVGVGHDWVPIGDIPGEQLFSVAFWYQAFVRATGRARAREEPMFWSRDPSKTYTYPCLTADLHHWQSKLGLDTSYTPHCIRVLGYNLSKAGNGEDLTVAHGGWMSAAHDRYERFSQSAQLSIPANMLQVDSVFSNGPSTRDISRGRITRDAFSVPAEASSDDGEADADVADQTTLPGDDFAPPGFETIHHVTPAGREYFTYRSPGGQVARSRVDAWRVHERERGQSAASDSEESALDGDECQPCEAETVDVSTPVATSSSNAPRQDGERLSAVARRLRSVTFAEPAADVVTFSNEQCGDPNCTVKSRNGLHTGIHIYPPPAPRQTRSAGR